MSYAGSYDDNRVHLQQEDRRFAGWQTVCGRQVASTSKPDGPWCHVCYPDKARSIEPVWEACRRWDSDVNALAERTNRRSHSARFSQADSSVPGGAATPRGPADTLSSREPT